MPKPNAFTAKRWSRCCGLPDGMAHPEGARDRFLKNIFRACAGLLLVAAIYHLAALTVASLAPPGAPWRHGLFIAIDLTAAVLMLRRPVWFVPIFALLTIQQIWSHGESLWDHWRLESQIHWISLATIIAAPAMLALLVSDLRSRASPSSAQSG